MLYLYLKSLHIIFVITWFAALFYMVRLFIYNTESHYKPEPDRSILMKQILVMQKRLWTIIAWPSALLTLILGTWLSIELNAWSQPWFHLKAGFVVLLYFYHFFCDRIHTQMTKGVYKYSTGFLRVWNEVATLILFAIVFLVVLKSTLDWIYGTLGLIGIAVALMLGIKWYKKYRNE